MGDSDGDGLKELIVGAYSPSTAISQFSIFERTSGTSFSTRWTSPSIQYSGSATSICAISVNNTDNDSYGEILIGTSEGQVQIFESTGHNIYNSTPKFNYQVGSTVGSSSSWCDLMVANLDGDSKLDIVYVNDDSDKAWIFETSGDDSWSVVWNEVIDPNTVDLYRLDSGDTDGDGNGEFAVTFGSPDGIAIYETIGDNSYATIFKATPSTDPTKVPDLPTGIDIVNIDQSPLPEVLVGGEFYGYWILGLSQPTDLLINNWDVLFDPPSPVENENVTITTSVTNSGATDLANVLVNFYDGDPDTGGILLGSTTITSLLTGLSGNASIIYQFADQGTHDIYVIVDPNNTISETLETNNKANSILNVADNDTIGPEIKNITFLESGGDGDLLIEDNEQVIIQWIATDPSGISSTSVNVDCQKNPVDSLGGDIYQIIIGPCNAGLHTFTITAIDADNSPATALIGPKSFVVDYHQPVIQDVNPDDHANNISRNTIVQK
jgi:hypothetical protein